MLLDITKKIVRYKVFPVLLFWSLMPFVYFNVLRTSIMMLIAFLVPYLIVLYVYEKTDGIYTIRERTYALLIFLFGKMAIFVIFIVIFGRSVFNGEMFDVDFISVIIRWGLIITLPFAFTEAFYVEFVMSRKGNDFLMDNLFCVIAYFISIVVGFFFTFLFGVVLFIVGVMDAFVYITLIF